MNSRIAKLLILLTMFGWATQAVAQSALLFDLIGTPVKVKNANFFTWLDQVSVTLIDPESQIKPISLYSYKISPIENSEILNDLLYSAAKNKIRVALLQPINPGNDSEITEYKGQGIRISRATDSGSNVTGSDFEAVLGEYKSSLGLESNDISHDLMIAFTKPLDLTKINPPDKTESIEMREFFTWSTLWEDSGFDP